MHRGSLRLNFYDIHHIGNFFTAEVAENTQRTAEFYY